MAERTAWDTLIEGGIVWGTVDDWHGTVIATGRLLSRSFIGKTPRDDGLVVDILWLDSPGDLMFDVGTWHRSDGLMDRLIPAPAADTDALTSMVFDPEFRPRLLPVSPAGQAWLDACVESSVLMTGLAGGTPEVRNETRFLGEIVEAYRDGTLAIEDAVAAVEAESLKRYPGVRWYFAPRGFRARRRHLKARKKLNQDVWAGSLIRIASAVTGVHSALTQALKGEVESSRETLGRIIDSDPTWHDPELPTIIARAARARMLAGRGPGTQAVGDS